MQGANGLLLKTCITPRHLLTTHKATHTHICTLLTHKHQWDNDLQAITAVSFSKKPQWHGEATPTHSYSGALRLPLPPHTADLIFLSLHPWHFSWRDRCLAQWPASGLCHGIKVLSTGWLTGVIAPCRGTKRRQENQELTFSLLLRPTSWALKSLSGELLFIFPVIWSDFFAMEELIWW